MNIIIVPSLFNICSTYTYKYKCICVYNAMRSIKYLKKHLFSEKYSEIKSLRLNIETIVKINIKINREKACICGTKDSVLVTVICLVSA